MARKIFQTVPTAMDIDTTGINSADRHMNVSDMDQILFVQGDSGPVSVTSNPQIEAHESVGAIITIVGMDDTKTLTFHNGDGLVLSGTAELRLNCILELLWCGDNYIELGRNF